MEREKMGTIIGLIAGVETAIIHLTNVVIAKANLDREEVAASFEASARLLSQQDPNNATLVDAVMKAVADGIRATERAGPKLMPTPPRE